MPEHPQNEAASESREVDWGRQLQRDRILKQASEESTDQFTGPGAAEAAAGGGKPAANPAANTKDIIDKLKLRVKLWYGFYYVLPLLAIIGLKIKDDDDIRKKAEQISGSGGGGAKGGTAEAKKIKADDRLPGPGAAGTGGGATGAGGALGGGGGDGGSGCVGFAISQIACCLMFETCCAGTACGVYILIVLALVALGAAVVCYGSFGLAC